MTTPEADKNARELQRLIEQLKLLGDYVMPEDMNNARDFGKLIHAHMDTFREFMIRGLGPDFTFLIPLVDQLLSGVFITHPASIRKHHNYLFGLGQHTKQVIQFAQALIYEDEESDEETRSTDCAIVAIAGLFHDVMKTSDYLVTYDTGSIVIDVGSMRLVDAINKSMKIEYSPYSKEIHHVAGGAIAFTQAWGSLYSDETRPEFARAVTHVLLSHHQLKEWGSPVSPRSKAAWAFHLGDMASVNISAQKFLREGDKGD